MQVFRTVTTAALIAAAGFGSIAAQAQTAQPLTRAEVKAQVAQAMHDGTLFRGGEIYTPATPSGFRFQGQTVVAGQDASKAAPVVAQDQAARGSVTAE
jgi:hypothetical protein